MVQELPLQCLEKVLYAGVVPAITRAADTGRDAVRGEPLLVCMLPSAIGVMQEPPLRAGRVVSAIQKACTVRPVRSFSASRYYHNRTMWRLIRNCSVSVGPTRRSQEDDPCL